MTSPKKHARIFAAAAAALLITALLCSCSLLNSGPLSQERIDEALERNEYASEDRRAVVEAAVSLVGKVTYFWGGKSYAIGPDPDWGTPREVKGTGHSTTGQTIPYGLDCSGFVQWCYIQLGRGKDWTIENVGQGTWHQWMNSEEIAKEELQPGDIVFENEYPGAKGNHVGIVIGFSRSGEPLIAHCSSGYDGVYVTPCGDRFQYYRRFAFMNG